MELIVDNVYIYKYTGEVWSKYAMLFSSYREDNLDQ
jgi:hypothetical protein